ncbi:hypothetical protein TWF506_004530 [Arthrobotrys conoides]|uniref:Uncharacterized protein n=1 Tax=Arthrobotrys conoides TaxID=74498 RepID=A0AAN8RHV8_9PEZI
MFAPRQLTETDIEFKKLLDASPMPKVFDDSMRAWANTSSRALSGYTNHKDSRAY